MSDTPSPEPTPLKYPNEPWQNRVVYSRRAGGYARRPNCVVCPKPESWHRANEIINGGDGDLPPGVGWEDELVYPFEFEEGTHTVEDVVDRLAEEHLPAEPCYVMFANPVYANPVYANPVYANPVYANPVYANPADEHASGSFANPVYANPVYASPVYANPVYANPVYANPYISAGQRPSTVRPASPPDRKDTDYADPDGNTTVVILDTGIAACAHQLSGGSEPEKQTVNYCPPMLQQLSEQNPAQWEIPDNDPETEPGACFIDPASGHGTFIAGIIQTLASGTEIVPRNVVTSYGDVDTLTVLDQVSALCDGKVLGPHTIVNMSFGGYADENMVALQRAVRCIRRKQAVVVASAGNDATSRPMFPACLPGVVGVAALDSRGPAPFSNHGSWVSACAPGTDLVSAFYQNFNGAALPWTPGSPDPDAFECWARWTGTSFAAPVVASALVREMTLTDCTANEAVKRVVEAPGLLRLPYLGTVVNIDMGDSTCI